MHDAQVWTTLMPDAQHWVIIITDTNPQHWAILMPVWCIMHSIELYWCLMHIIETWMHKIEPYWCMMHRFEAYCDAWCTALGHIMLMPAQNWAILSHIDVKPYWCLIQLRMHSIEPYWCMMHRVEPYWKALSHTDIWCTAFSMVQGLSHNFDAWCTVYWGNFDAWGKLLTQIESYWYMIRVVCSTVDHYWSIAI